MKKLLTILILLLAVVTQGRATNIQLWPETEYLLSDTEYCINSIFGNVTNSSTLRISYETTGDAPTLQAFHKNSSWTSADFYNNNLTGSPLEISISTDEQVSNLKERGLYLKGQSAKITKIELNDTQIWPEVSHQLTNWTEWNIKTKNFSSVVQNKKILISYSTEGSDNQLLEIVYKNSDDDWKSKNFDDTDFVDGTNYYTLTGNPEILTLSSSAATYLQKNGLYFRSREGSITITKIEILNNVFDDNGSADLSNLVAEDGNTITSSGGNYTITSNSASSGATLTHAEGETITGKSRLVATFSAEQEVTVIANYTGTDGFSSITKGSDNGGSGDFVVVVPLDNSKTLANVVIKKVTAGDIVLKSLVVDTQTDGLPSGNIIGDDGKVDLARFVVQNKDSRYNIGTFTLTPKEGWTGIQVWPESENITGKKELNVKFAEAATAKIEVGYVSEGSSSVIMSEAAKEVKLMLDNTKTIQRVVIQPTTVTAITLSEVALNTERTAYENEKELLNPETKPTISNNSNTQIIDYWKFGNAAEGDKIIVYISNVTTETSGDNSGKAKLTMSAAAQRPSLGSTWGGYADKEFTANSTDLQEIKYNLTGDNLTNVKNQGFYVNAAYGSFQLEKITMISSNDIPSSEPSYTLTKNVTPAASGSIQVQTVVGEVATNTDEISFASGTNLKLTATPATGYDFSGWTIGDDSQSDNPYTFSINSDITATATFTAIPAFSLDGFAADENNTYNGETHALTTTSEWSGMQLWIGNNSTYNGSKLVVKTAEDCKLKITVGYVGEGQAELSDEAAGKSHAVTLDNTKKIQKVIIQNQETGTVTFSSMELDPSYTLTILSAENGSFTVSDGTNDIANGASVAYGTSLTLTATPADDYSFEKWTIGGEESTENPHTLTITEATSIAATFTANAIPAFSLDGFAADENNTYNGETHALTTTSEWSGMQLWIGNNSTYNGSKLVVKTAEDCKLKITVGYVGEGQAELSDEAANKNHAVTLESSKKIQKVIIQNQEAGTVTFTEFALDPSYTLTITAPENGSFTVKSGETELSTGASVAYGTSLTLTPTANDGYSFTKWTINDTDITDNPYIFTQTEATTVSATFTADAVVTPAFTDGKADLSKFEVQDAEKVTYDAETHTITVTEGWTGVQITATSADDVQGKELRITFSEAAKVKATVKYADESAADNIMSEAATVLYMVIDGTKKVSQIQIQPTEAGSVTLNEVIVNAESTKPAEPEPVITPVFTDGKADLSKLESQNAEKVTVSVADGKATVTTTEGWTGVQLTVIDGESVSGKEIKITMQDAKALKVSVKKSSEDAGTDFNLDAAATQYIEFSGTTSIYQIQIQPTEAATLVISEIAVNAESTKPAEPEPTPGQTGVNISLAELNEGWSSTYDATSKTITTTGDWGARGWYVGDDRYNDKGSITVKFNAVEHAVTLKMEYTNANDEAKDISVGAAAGETEITLDIPANIKTINKVYITYEPAGTLTLTEATVNDKVIDNRTEKTLVEKSQAIADGDILINRGLFSNAVAGDIIRIYGTPGEGAKIALEPADYSGALDGASWTAFEESPFALKLTETVLNTIKEKDLLVRGENYTFNKAVLYTENELGKAIADATKYTLNLTSPENGTVTIKQGGETVEPGEFEKNTELTLTATAAEGYTFEKWTIGDEESTANPLTLTMSADKTVSATFTANTPEKTGVDISLAEMNEGWNSTYDAATKTITTTGEWAARGWYVGDDRYNDKGSITVKFNAVEHAVTLKMEYTNANDEAKDVSVGAAAGETEITLDIPANIKTINKVYITYEPVGTLTLTEATVNDKVIDNRTEKTLVEKSQAIADGDILINRGLFSNAVAGDVVRIYGGGLGGTSKIALEPADFSGALDGANWVAFTESPFVLKLTAAAISVIQEKGLLIRGENYTFTKAVLYTEKELGKEIIDVQKYTLTLSTPENGTVVIKKGNEEVKAGEFDENTELTLTATAAEGYEFTKWQKNGEDAGTEATLTVKMTADMTIAAVFSKKTEPIIDEETGETDLTEMTPQDPSTTSVEYNDEDQSITITTTEPYKAAQIWFNEPEKLAKGNVLIVYIAESGVNVTVTVKYTDGTESSMTSTAHAASARHAAVAGTKISVPLETGKDVQNIEVKNAEAGTITIQKMVVTTKNVFTNGVADLSMAKPQSNAIYDTSTYSLAVTKGWTGITITPLTTEQVSGMELMLQFTSAAQVKVAVTYNEGEGPSVIMDEAAKYLQMTLDKTKTVKEIQIQPTAAGVVQFKSLAVNQTVSPAPDYVAPLEEGERRTLFESMEGTQLSWNDICQMAANYGAILEEREQIEVYISARTEDCEWPKVFIKDANGEECGTVAELSAVDLFPYMAKFKLTNEMVEQLRDGFSICGDGIIVTQVCLYKPAALKAGDIDVADLNGGYQSSYDATSKTITTTSRWAARGWDIGDNRYNNYDVVVVQFEAVEFPVTLRMEYVDMNGETKTLSQGASAGNTQVEIEIPDDIQQINYVYLMYENPGTLILTNAEALRSTYRTKTLNLADFEAISDGTTYDNKTFAMTSTADNGTIQLWLNSPIEGGEDLTLTLVNDAAKVSMLVGYTDGSQVSVESEGTTALLPLNHSKNIQKIMISIQTAGTVQFESIQMTQRILTFIPSVKTDIHYQQNDDSWYRLDGKRVSQPGRGIYIHNGKKIVIK